MASQPIWINHLQLEGVPLKSPSIASLLAALDCYEFRVRFKEAMRFAHLGPHLASVIHNGGDHYYRHVL